MAYQLPERYLTALVNLPAVAHQPQLQHGRVERWSGIDYILNRYNTMSIISSILHPVYPQGAFSLTHSDWGSRMYVNTDPFTASHLVLCVLSPPPPAT